MSRPPLPAATVAQLLAQAVAALGDNSATPRIDAEALATHALHLSKSELITRAGHVVDDAERGDFLNLVARRRAGEPIAYLTGRREFWSLDFHVSPAVLIPRPETELLVEQALARIPEDAAWTIADLGTGSGVIAAAIAHERRRCHVIATDISTAALAVARTNAQHLGITNVEFRHGEWLQPLAGMRLDLILSNPPYLAAHDPHLTQADVRFEPVDALVAGADGLAAIRIIARDARSHLRHGGYLLLEHGFDQAAAVRAILVEQRYGSVATYPDLQRLPRVSVGVV